MAAIVAGTNLCAGSIYVEDASAFAIEGEITFADNSAAGAGGKNDSCLLSKSMRSFVEKQRVAKEWGGLAGSRRWPG